MISSTQAGEILLKDIKDAINQEAEKIATQIENDYNQLPSHLGKADISWELLYDTAKEELGLIFLAKGQRALIAEYGKGSAMAGSKENPSLQEYLQSDLFNTERLKHGMATLSRPKSVGSSSYLDLDFKEHKKTANKLINRETGQVIGEDKTVPINKRFLPIKPRFVVRTAIIQRLQIITNHIITSVVASDFIRKMIDGYTIEVKI